MIVSTDTQKVFDKSSIPFDKTLSKVGIEEKLLILINGIYKNRHPAS